MGSSSPIDNDLVKDVVLEVKTTALAKHYERYFGAVCIPMFQSSVSRCLIADEVAKQILPLAWPEVEWYFRKSPEKERITKSFPNVSEIWCAMGEGDGKRAGIHRISEPSHL